MVTFFVQDTTIGDYDVPKGTMVVPLQWAIHTDPAYWDEPLQYRPDRFLLGDGSLAKPEAFLPFQSGKRLGQTKVAVIVVTDSCYCKKFVHQQVSECASATNSPRCCCSYSLEGF